MIAKVKGTSDVVKSPMNYTGGKYKLLKQILPLFPERIDGRFIDLFCGGLDISVNTVPSRKIIANDYNSNVIGIYNAMKKITIEELLNYIESVISSYELTITNTDGYNKFRDYYNKSLEKNPLDLFILICYSFNHQIRFNRNGDFNMPFGKDRSYFNEKIKENLIKFHKSIIDRDIIFTNNDFRDIKVNKLKQNDFVYCDPPYLITCASYNEQDGWNETCERDLYRLMDELDKNGIMFAVSNVISNKGKVNDILLEWSRKYNVHHLSKTYSNCSYHAKDRDSTTTDEVLITNY